MITVSSYVFVCGLLDSIRGGGWKDARWIICGLTAVFLAKYRKVRLWYAPTLLVAVLYVLPITRWQGWWLGILWSVPIGLLCWITEPKIEHIDFLLHNLWGWFKRCWWYIAGFCLLWGFSRQIQWEWFEFTRGIYLAGGIVWATRN